MMKQTHHSDFWFADGSVILATSSTLYRVHKGILSSQSKFFRDLFELPIDTAGAGECTKGDDIGDEYEGLPVVRMAGDEDEHVEWLIRTLYNPYEKCVYSDLTSSLSQNPLI